ncbi:hypothetical protein B0H11DRAFT_2072655 [Mycena galericulata]|nr:hypothetical protein B0H11DRAFT_2072655 [Mycena galericulata]
MLRWTSTALRRSPRALYSCRWAALPARARLYTVSAPESTPESGAKPTKLPELPSQEEFTGPIVESDFSQYLAPLYDRGWQFTFDRPYPEVKATSSLKRSFTFPSVDGVVKFSQNTRDAKDALISVFRNLEYDVALSPPEGLTRSDIRVAFQTEKEYLNSVGTDSPVPSERKLNVSPVESLKAMERIQHKKRPFRKVQADPKELVPIVPGSLPPLPPAPGSPPPSITQTDLDTYLKPLLAGEWTVGGPRLIRHHHITQQALLRHPALHRVLLFTDYATARDFLHTAITMIPTPTPGSLGGVELRLRQAPGHYRVSIWSISELAPGAQKPYGISLADVRFALQLEDEVNKNWIGRAQNSKRVHHAVPNTMEDVWNYYKDVAASREKVTEEVSP